MATICPKYITAHPVVTRLEVGVPGWHFMLDVGGHTLYLSRDEAVGISLQLQYLIHNVEAPREQDAQ